MKKITHVGKVGLGFACIALAAFVSSCGDDNSQPELGSSAGLGNLTVDCAGQAGQQQQQQKQMSFQQQQQQGCVPQQIQFKQSKVDDFDVKLDCSARQVTVQAKPGIEGLSTSQQGQQKVTLPIEADGTVKGKITHPQQLQSDGKGNNVCWVVFNVDINGKADCDKPVEGTDQTQDNLNLKTQIDLTATNMSDLQAAGIAGGPAPSPSASASPSPSSSPSPTASASPSPSPSPSASGSPSPTPSVSVTPTGGPVVVCIVDNPCPVVAETQVACPAE